MKKLILLSLFLVATTPAFASGISQATINEIMIDTSYGEKAFIALDQDLLPRETATCHENDKWEYVVDISTKLGEKIYSNLLTAYAAQKKANFYGTGECFHPGIEQLRRLEILN